MRTPDEAAIPHVNFILQPEFPLTALVLASEALRSANQNSGRRLFGWSFVSETGEPVRASNGMWFAADCAIQAMPLGVLYLLFQGNLPTQRNSRPLLSQIRAAARFGAIIGAVDTGAFALTQAGVIGGETAPEVVLHWEAEAAYRERFPSARPLDRIHLLEDKRAHCAGGVATLDLMLDVIARLKGDALANEVANALIHTRRASTQRQRGDGARDPARDGLSERLIATMERHLDFPLRLEELATELDLAPRTLSDLCRRSFGESPMRLYLRVRLQAARNFLFYEEFSIKDVSVACGFSYPAVFSRVFKAQFGQTPREFRERFREQQKSTMRPEIRRLIAK